ncbi:hypothetical protein EMCRGX_G013149 [Ephydatia muelleri]
MQGCVVVDTVLTQWHAGPTQLLAFGSIGVELVVLICIGFPNLRWQSSGDVMVISNVAGLPLSLPATRICFVSVIEDHTQVVIYIPSCVTRCLYCNTNPAAVFHLPFFIVDLNRLNNSSFFTITHKSHSVIEISTAAKTHQMEISGALLDAKEVVTKLTGAIDENNRMIEEVEISKRNAFLAINQAFEILQQTLEERKKTLLSELEAISLSKTTALTLQKEQFEKMVGDIGHYTDMASQILQTHTDHEIVALGGLIPTELQATLKRVQTISLTPNQHSNISVSVKTDDLVTQLSKLGEIIVFFPSPSSSTWMSTSVARVGTRYHVKVQSKTSKGEEYPHGGVEMKGEMRSKTHNGAVVYGEVEDHRDGTYTITLTPQTAGPHQLLITMDGQHVQNSPNDLDVRPKRDYHTLCNAQQVIQCNRPLCVAIHDNGDIYVGSYDHCIYVFDQTGQLKNTIGSSGSGNGQFSSPYGISIKGDVLYVADYGNHRVQKLTSSGKFLHKFGQQGSGQGQFNSPVAVIIDSNNKLIVSENHNHRIQIFNENGGWLLTIVGKGSGNHSFQSPWGLALDPQGNIHVAAHGSDTIKVFTKEGVYVRMYGDPNRPIGIAIDGEGYSLVSEYSGHCLSIYDHEGNKIHTVGNLKNPHGTALDPRDGSVFIANYGANTGTNGSQLWDSAFAAQAFLEVPANPPICSKYYRQMSKHRDHLGDLRAMYNACDGHMILRSRTWH